MKLQYLPNRQVKIEGKIHELNAVAKFYVCTCGNPLVEKWTPQGWRVMCQKHGETEYVEKKTTHQAKEWLREHEIK